MRARCTNEKNDSFQHYGGRGIKFCSRWSDYDIFFQDMGECPDGLTLDRIDNNADYGPGNCRWATIREQLNNQRRNRLITFNGKTQTLSYWADDLGVSLDTLSKRLSRLSLSDAMKAGSIRPEWKHGTRHGYESGCRCDDCKSAHAARHREMRKRRRQKMLNNENNGKER